MNALILNRNNLITHQAYDIIDTQTFHQYHITTHESFPVGSRQILNIETLKSIKKSTDIGAYHPH